MAKMHYSLPSFNDRTEHIDLRTYGYNQPLVIVDADGAGSYGIFLVRDNTQVSETVDNAITNNHIVSLFDQLGADITYLTYNDILTKIDNSDLKPGSFYGIIDYHTNNRTEYNADDYHLSPDSTLILQAVSPNKLSSKALDLSNPTDEVVYKIDNLTSIRLNVKANDSTLDNIYLNAKNKFLEDIPFNGTLFEVTFIDEHNIKLGTATKLPSGVKITAYQSDNRHYAYLYEGSSDVSFDSNTGILTLLNGYTFKYNHNGTHFLYCSIAELLVNTKEHERGIILSRKEVVTNVFCDYDFRNYRYRLYKGTATSNFYDNGGSGYILPTQDDYTPTQDSSGNDTGYTNDGDSILVPSVDTITHDQNGIILKNGLIITGSKYIIVGGIYKESKIVNSRVLYIKNTYYSSFERVRYSVLAGIINLCDFKTLSKLVTAGVTFDTTTFFSMSQSILGCGIKNCDFRQDFSGWCFNFSNTNIRNTTFLGLFEDVKASQSGLLLNNLHFTTSSEVYGISINNSINDLTVKLDYFENLYFSDAVDNAKIIIDGNQESLTFNELSNSDITISSSDVIYGNIIDSTVKFGSDVENTTVESITNSSITHDSDYTLLDFSAIVNADVRNNPVTFELPSNPYEQEEFTFVDMYANASVNNITVNTSSSPATGVVNYINGGGSKVINKNYGLFTIRYSSTAGWLVITESITNSDVDNITLGYDTNNDYTIKNIDYIIDDDGQSIDGSDTAMSDAHSELVTRAYVDTQVTGSAFSQEFSQSDLSSGYLTVNHNLGAVYKVCNVTVMDDNSNQIEPDGISFDSNNSLTIDMRSLETLNGTWSLVVNTSV